MSVSNIIDFAAAKAARALKDAPRCSCGDPYCDCDSAIDYHAAAMKIAERARRLGTLEELDAAVDEILDLCTVYYRDETYNLAQAVRIEATVARRREMLYD